MRVIWEVVGDVELVHHFKDWNENFKKRDGEKAWRKLAQVIDMTEDELNRDIERRSRRSVDKIERGERKTCKKSCGTKLTKLFSAVSFNLPRMQLFKDCLDKIGNFCNRIKIYGVETKLLHGSLALQCSSSKPCREMMAWTAGAQLAQCYKYLT